MRKAVNPLAPARGAMVKCFKAEASTLFNTA